MADVVLDIDKFEFNAQADKDGKILEIEGRNSGIIGWILTQLGISVRSFLTITRREVTFKFSNLGGITYIVCPLDTVTCSLCAAEKPRWMLFSGVLIVLYEISRLLTPYGGLDLFNFLILLAGAGLLYWYYISKNLTITFSTGDMGDTHGLAFSTTTINGKPVTFESLLEVIEYLNHYLIEIHTKNKK